VGDPSFERSATVSTLPSIMAESGWAALAAVRGHRDDVAGDTELQDCAVTQWSVEWLSQRADHLAAGRRRDGLAAILRCVDPDAARAKSRRRIVPQLIPQRKGWL
jgi:hypothetical protein